MSLWSFATPDSSEEKFVPLGTGQPGVLETAEAKHDYKTVFVVNFSGMFLSSQLDPAHLTCEDPNIEIFSAKPPLVLVQTILG